MWSFALSTAKEESNKPSVFPAIDEGWFPRIAAGDGEAFQCLYQATSRALYGYLLALVRNTHLAEDVLHDTYLQIRAQAHRYQPQGKPLAWLLTVARNQGRMALRAESVRAYSPLEEADGVLSATFSCREDRLVLEAALRELGDIERQIVLLHAVAGCRHREIAALLELPLSTVLSKYHRALGKLKKQLSS